MLYEVDVNWSKTLIKGRCGFPVGYAGDATCARCGAPTKGHPRWVSRKKDTTPRTKPKGDD